MKNFLLAAVAMMLTMVAHAQIYNVYEVTNTDTLHFDGETIVLPSLKVGQKKTFIVVLDDTYICKSIELDILTPGVEFYGYDPKTNYLDENGNKIQFIMWFRTDDVRQKYEIRATVKYLLIRTDLLFYKIGLDFEFEK